MCVPQTNLYAASKYGEGRTQCFHIYTCQDCYTTALVTSIRHINSQIFWGYRVPAAEYLSMQHAHTEIAVQALNAFQVIVIHPKDLQVDLHTGNVQHAGQCC